MATSGDWKAVSSSMYGIDADSGKVTNLNWSDMHFTRLHAPQHPFPADSDAIFFLSVESVSPGQTEISFGAVPDDSHHTNGRVVGHCSGEVGLSCYGPGYRTYARHRGWWGKDGNNVGDLMKEIDNGSKLVLRWSAESRSLSAEIDGHDQGSQEVPPGSFFLAATCDGGNASTGRPVSFTLPAMVITLDWSPGDALDKARVQCTNLSGEELLVLDVNISDLPTTVVELREQIQRGLFAETVQHPMLMIVTRDGQDLAKVSDSASVQSVFEESAQTK
mmetsp:Transcript_2494/g.2700  ORF Transcript_2494/g.2700 Transcript_2494/m.2700 type:complete len:276 (+) Transcript_2494:100-927(+)